MYLGYKTRNVGQRMEAIMIQSTKQGEIMVRVRVRVRVEVRVKVRVRDNAEE